MKTWQKEALFVAIILFSFAFLTGNKRIEYVGAGAVLLGFCHIQIGMRFSEAEERSVDPVRVHCYKYSIFYLCSKEILWTIYFLGLGAWSGLVGVAIYLGYPFWRRFYLSRKHDEKQRR